MDHMTIYLILAGVFGLFMAWGIGANDVANAMATSVGSKAITIKQAIIIAAIFEFAGAVLAGGEVTSAIRKDIFDFQELAKSAQYGQVFGEYIVYGMLASLLAAGIWLVVATNMGWPVSTTHSIVGAIVGFSIAGFGASYVAWGQVYKIVATWVISPVLAGTVSFFLFKSVQKLILNTETPISNARKYAPFYVFLTGFIMTMVTLLKGLKHVGIKMPVGYGILLAVFIGVIISVISAFYIKKIKTDPKDDKKFYFTNVEKIFVIPMVITACAMAFAHGSNDVANAIGPVASIASYVDNGGSFFNSNGGVVTECALPLWILLLGGVGIVLGLVVMGHKVIATVGSGITELTPSRGFACVLAAAATVVVASGTGIPISTTHTLVGAVLGVGFARGIGALNLGVIGKIFISWIITLPAGGILAILFFFMFKGMFS